MQKPLIVVFLTYAEDQSPFFWFLAANDDNAPARTFTFDKNNLKVLSGPE